MSNSLWPHGPEHARPSCLPLPPGVGSIHVRWIMSINFVLCRPLLLLPSHQGLFQGDFSSLQMAKVLEPQLQDLSFQWALRLDFLQNGWVCSLCGPGDSQESPPAPQFKSINSSAISFLYSPALTPIHHYWKKHSFEYAARWCLCFLRCCQDLSSLSSQEAGVF